MSIILPSLYSELETDAMPLILSHLKEVKYLNQIVLGLDVANEQQYRQGDGSSQKQFIKDGISRLSFFGFPSVGELDARIESSVVVVGFIVQERCCPWLFEPSSTTTLAKKTIPTTIIVANKDLSVDKDSRRK